MYWKGEVQTKRRKRRKESREEREVKKRRRGRVEKRKISPVLCSSVNALPRRSMDCP